MCVRVDGDFLRRIGHLRGAVKAGDMPVNLVAIKVNVSPVDARTRVFTLHRTLRNYAVLTGFKSGFVTWLATSRGLRVSFCTRLSAMAGKPVRRQSQPE
jgi:hypothetical protein